MNLRKNLDTTKSSGFCARASIFWRDTMKPAKKKNSGIWKE